MHGSSRGVSRAERRAGSERLATSRRTPVDRPWLMQLAAAARLSLCTRFRNRQSVALSRSRGHGYGANWANSTNCVLYRQSDRRMARRHHGAAGRVRNSLHPPHDLRNRSVERMSGMVGMIYASEKRRPLSVMMPRFGGQSIRTTSIRSTTGATALLKMSVGLLRLEASARLDPSRTCTSIMSKLDGRAIASGRHGLGRHDASESPLGRTTSPPVRAVRRGRASPASGLRLSSPHRSSQMSIAVPFRLRVQINEVCTFFCELAGRASRRPPQSSSSSRHLP